jgi:hypothetical protein
MNIVNITPILFALVLAGDGQPVAKIPVSKDTTYVTGPFDRDGYIDYEAALNDRLGKGIRPEMNANVVLWKALGPKPESGGRMPAEFFTRLGIQEPTLSGDYFIRLETFAKDHLKVDEDRAEALDKELELARQRLWQEKDHPQFAAWLNLNEKPLALVLQATKLRGYYSPLVCPAKESDPKALLGALLSGPQTSRQIGRALATRAMMRAGQGRYDDAFEDLLGCHRLGRLIAQGGTSLDLLAGIATDRYACDAHPALLACSALDGVRLRRWLGDLQHLPRFSSTAEKVDLADRFVFLDTVQLLRRGRPDLLASGGKEPGAFQKLGLATIDWDTVLREGNRWFDRIVAALRLEDRSLRNKELKAIYDTLMAQRKKAGNPALGMVNVLGPGQDFGKISGKLLGELLPGLLIPAFDKIQGAADRTEQISRNLHVAYALAAYQRERGRYPSRLGELSPRYLSTVPMDLFSGKALVYRPSANGYLLYSVGSNGLDEGGRTYDDVPSGDDLDVRLPPQ